MVAFLEVTLLSKLKRKMSEKDKREAEQDDITEVDQEKILRHMPKTELVETRESPED